MKRGIYEKKKTRFLYAIVNNKHELWRLEDVVIILSSSQSKGVNQRDRFL